MSPLFSDCHTSLQEELGTRNLAAAQEQGIVHTVLTPEERIFISTRDMMFLSTVDPQGRPTVSYKGGDPGFVRCDGDDILFPSYNGNGMFLSLGNLSANPEVGLLFIDLETPQRLRVQGRARIVPATRKEGPGIEHLVRVTPQHIFVNCTRYVHRHRKVEASRYVPRPGEPTPVAAWKRIDFVRAVISEEDRARVDALGTITQSEYDAMVAAGEA